MLNQGSKKELKYKTLRALKSAGHGTVLLNKYWSPYTFFKRVVDTYRTSEGPGIRT
jgi:hypothetical protein